MESAIHHICIGAGAFVFAFAVFLAIAFALLSIFQPPFTGQYERGFDGP